MYLTAVNSFTNTKEACFVGYFSKKFSVVNGDCVFHRDVFKTIRYNEDMVNCEDISIFALAFALFSSSRIVRPLAIIYKQDDSLRHVYAFSADFVPNIVDEIFTEKRLPAKLLSYKKTYAARLYLSQSRAAYLAGNKKTFFIVFIKPS
ncbi:MAG: hypothetical protein A6F71_07575 [Cycloclasticus sp. symbiont of Poecilosclerida sp. M]|nr:MAG: hypothetical protein A6F71_07575 [Cycloclasticus sp. symbiont of Poecilosclerida sp. M]